MTYIRDWIIENKPELILDYGCGDGRLLYELDKIFDIPIYGYDVDIRAQSIAMALTDNGNLVPNVGIFENPSQFGAFDCIVMMEVMEHIKDKDLFINVIPRMRQMLRDSENPVLIISVPTMVLPLIEKHYHHYTLELLQTFLAPEFEIYQHQYLFSYTPLTYLFTRLLSNPLFELNYPPLCRLIWRLHKKYTYYSNEKQGAHLVVFAKPVI